MVPVCLTIPVHNEELQLETSVTTLRNAVNQWPEFRVEIQIIDNGSTDRTGAIGKRLALEAEGVSFLQIDAKGRGRALRYAWNMSTADYLAYMDVDLSTDIRFFCALLRPLINGKADVSIGSRWVRPELAMRRVTRKFLSRCYNALIRQVFGSSILDSQCGFKAITKDAAHELLDLIEDNRWFFDTELLILASRLGFRVLEIPVSWKDDADSRVRVIHDSIQTMNSILRLKRTLKRRPPQRLHRTRASSDSLPNIRS